MSASRTEWQKSRPQQFTFQPDGLPDVTAGAPSVVMGAPISLTRALTQYRADATVLSIGNDRQTLTLSAAIGGSTRGLIGHNGVSWLDLDQYGQFPVKVATFTSATTVRLAEPLPHDPGPGAGTLSWNLWYADFIAGEVGAAVARAVPWSVTWTQDQGADAPTRERMSDGLIAIVTRVFDTGLTHETLLHHLPYSAEQVPDRQSSFQPQIDLGLTRLKRWISARLRAAGNFVDQVAGEQFAEVHALLTEHFIIKAQILVGYTREGNPIDEAKDEFEVCMSDICWVDANGDGVVDDGETGINKAALPGNSAGALWMESGYTAPTWDPTR